MRHFGKLIIAGYSATILAAASTAMAQEPAPQAAPQAQPPAPAPAPAPAQPAPQAQAQAQGQAQGTAAVGLPPPATAVAGDSDHDQMVGRFALGYLGRRTMLIGNGLGTETAAGAEQAVRTVAAPVIGIRYWITSLLGIDGGIGFFYDAGSNKTNLQPPLDAAGVPAVNQTYAGTTTFIFHVGVPLALAGAKHFSFQVVPEANVGFSGQTINGAPDQKNRGFHLDIGARAGAEIHFGFINIPQLSLQGSIGLLYALDHTSTSIGPSESSRNRGAISTTVYDNPWNIFTSNVAALYYF